MGIFHLGHLFGCSLGHQLSTSLAAFRSDIDDPVRTFDDVEIMLDHHHAVPGRDKTLNHAQKMRNVLEMKTCGRFVQDIKGSTGITLGQFPSEFDPLGLATGLGRGGLPQGHIGKSNFDQGIKNLDNLGMLGKDIPCLAHG